MAPMLGSAHGRIARAPPVLGGGSKRSHPTTTYASRNPFPDRLRGWFLFRAAFPPRSDIGVQRVGPLKPVNSCENSLVQADGSLSVAQMKMLLQFKPGPRSVCSDLPKALNPKPHR